MLPPAFQTRGVNISAARERHVTIGAFRAHGQNHWLGVPRLFLTALLVLWSGWAAAQQPPEPEGPSGFTAKRAAVATKHMAAAANPLAAEAGREILRMGGSAVDAVIAMQMVLTLVEPQSSGIGGGGFLVQYDASRKGITTYDGRETAPAAATADMFLNGNGQPPPYPEARLGGLAVGTPGVLRMLELAHRDHGRLPWARLFEPAMRLAESGFAVTPRLRQLIQDNPQLREMPGTAGYFFDKDGNPRAVGDRLENPQLFETLRLIANGGADAFYRGQIARDIVAAVTDAKPQGPRGHAGRLSLADLALYRAMKRDPVCGIYRSLRVCGMGPPSSGGVTVAQTMEILDHFTLRDLSPGSLEAVHLISEASRLAFADRARYVADGDFVPVPVRALLGARYLEQRAELISPVRTMGHAEPGRVGQQVLRRGPTVDDTVEIPSTSHMTAVDAAGNVAALTSSIEGAFGSSLMVRGFMLNNEMTDFALRPMNDGVPSINRIEPGKRPRSSMAPTIVTDRQGRFVLTVGSPGAARIIPYVVQTLVATIDWRLDIQRAVSLPHHVNLNGPTELERGTPLADLAPALRELGHDVEIRPETSGLQGIMAVRRNGKVQYIGGADPRREGEALGD
jgi:gamma-glutamyltranspeptidase / glutathione hydrolase